MSIASKVMVGVFFALCVMAFAGLADAHQSGCHRWHSCPSDTGSYVCGDLGYACQYSTYSTYSQSSYYTYFQSGYYTQSSYGPTCPANSYSLGSSCYCNYGYVADGAKCVSKITYCTNEYGLMSTYNSLTNSCKCMVGYEIGILGKCVYDSDSSYGSYYPMTSYSSLSCPAHSSESKTDSTKCSCDIGYKVNKDKDKCIKITSKENDKMCQADFGSKSKWNKKYDSDGAPTCSCKSGYEWNHGMTKCVKEE